MKKILVMLFCTVMALTLMACGAEKNEEQVQSSINTTGNSNTVSNDNTSPSESEDVIYPSSVTENVSTTTDAANVLSVTVYESNIADVCRQLEKRPKGSVAVYFDGTPYMLLYADLGDGLFARVCKGGDGSILDTIPFDISDTEIVFHADMSSYKDFSFKEVSSYSEIIDYDGNGGGKITYAAADVVKYADAKASDDNKETESDSSHNENLNETKNETKNESEVNAILSQAAGHYEQGNNSVDLIDNGNGTYTLQDVNLYYKDVVELGPPPGDGGQRMAWCFRKLW